VINKRYIRDKKENNKDSIATPGHTTRTIRDKLEINIDYLREKHADVPGSCLCGVMTTR
jgi:hypothetical protein